MSPPNIQGLSFFGDNMYHFGPLNKVRPVVARPISQLPLKYGSSTAQATGGVTAEIAPSHGRDGRPGKDPGSIFPQGFARNLANVDLGG